MSQAVLRQLHFGLEMGQTLESLVVIPCLKSWENNKTVEKNANTRMRIEFKSPQKARGPRPPPSTAPQQQESSRSTTDDFSSSTMYPMEYSLSQTAPFVGRHEKNTSLVGFDPLLMDSSSKELKQIGSKNAISTTGTVTSLPVDERDQAPSSPAPNFELRSELRAIASEIGKLSPQVTNPPQKHASKVTKTEKTPSKNQSTANCSTPTKNRKNRPSSFLTPPPMGKNKNKSNHRKTKSLDSSEGVDVAIKSAMSPPPLTESQPSLSNTMMQELWEVQLSNSNNKVDSNEQIESLVLPSLAKPRPTSFLTGTEIQLTSEMDASEWQVELPAKEEFDFTTHVSSFLESYRKEECLLDLGLLVGCGRQDLAYFASGQLSIATERIAKFHRPIVESLLECGSDLQQVQGYFRSKAHDSSPDSFREVLVLERQRQFLCAFRGTTSEQQGKVDRQPVTTKLSDNGGVSVFSDRYKAAVEFEPKLFALLDRLMEENPFCDFVFCGHGFGAAMATFAAYRYAWARSELRVAALVSGSAKVGLNDFRLSAHSLGNLKVARLELGHVRPLTQTGYHIGHTIRLNPSKANAPVRAYRFADTKQDPSPIRKLRLNREKSITEYVGALEELGQVWVKSFYRQDGAGVRGKDNESRYMV